MRSRLKVRGLELEGLWHRVFRGVLGLRFRRSRGANASLFLRTDLDATETVGNVGIVRLMV